MEEVDEEEFLGIINICEKLLREDPDDPELWTRKAMALMGLNRGEKPLKF